MPRAPSGGVHCCFPPPMGTSFTSLSAPCHFGSIVAPNSVGFIAANWCTSECVTAPAMTNPPSRVGDGTGSVLPSPHAGCAGQCRKLRTFGPSAHPELVDQRLPLRVVLVVADPLGEEVDRLAVVGRHVRGLGEQLPLERAIERMGRRRILRLDARRMPQLAVERAVAELCGIRRCERA